MTNRVRNSEDSAPQVRARFAALTWTRFGRVAGCHWPTDNFDRALQNASAGTTPNGMPATTSDK